ncbi:hypothetical protein [Sphingopyxis sp. H115]|uniref:hypothetical protein n=1 Tax=Sphingopyxis sp. H115 TaxID=1759073 RepID=UPI000736CA0A|nr:hypothetical protein [Sphingopyxis sp. H115]KTE02868.1 hypothetical protein ATE71_19900 [Sphingopyxis sp. H115]
MSSRRREPPAPRPFLRRGIQVVPQTRGGWAITAGVMASLTTVQGLLLALAFALPRWSVPAGIAFAVVTVGVVAAFYAWSWRRADPADRR